MALRLLRRPHVLLVIFLMAMLAVFPLIERSGVGLCILNLLMVTSIVVALYPHTVLPDRRTWFEFLYLSMTTLSSTGFGDIVPVSSGARSAVILEQFVGVLYVALVISRLAGFAGRVSRGLG